MAEESGARPVGSGRAGFSCSDETWNKAKATWAKQRRKYLAWTKWLEAALDEKTQRTKEQLGRTELEPAPDKLPPGRREYTGTGIKPRRSFTCSPAVWREARAAWFAELERYPAYSDWVEEAISEKILADAALADLANETKSASKTR